MATAVEAKSATRLRAPDGLGLGANGVAPAVVARADPPAIEPGNAGGDAVHVLRQCADCLGGDCDVTPDDHGRNFARWLTLRCPAPCHAVSSAVLAFALPSSAFVIAIDDSRMQREVVRMQYL